jgi:hypothetical protein
MVADQIESQGGMLSAGIIRQLSGIVVEQATRLDALTPAQAPNGCPVCGEPVEQPARGRPRIYCSEDHRRQAQHDRRAA